MLLRAVALVLALLSAGCTTAERMDPRDPASMGTNFVVPETLTFDDGVEVVRTPSGAEPGAEVAPDGTLYIVVWTQVHRSTDGGTTWQQLPTPFSHYGDSDLAVTPDGVLHFVGMPLANQDGPRLPYYRSEDRGESWSPPRDLGRGESIDRPWIAESSQGDLVLTWNHVESDESLARVSRDGGDTWSDPFVLASPRYKVPGPPVWRGNEIVQPLNRFERVDFAHSEDYGRSWRIHAGPEGQFAGFPTLAVDAGGDLVMAVTSMMQAPRRDVLVFEADGPGGTWYGPRRVSGEGDAVLPWVIAGRPGSWAVAYYEREADAREPTLLDPVIDQPSASLPWHVEVSMGRGSHSKAVRAAADVRSGDICTNGSGCDAAAWEFKDYFEMEVTPVGNLFVVHMTGPSASGDFPVRAVVSKYG